MRMRDRSRTLWPLLLLCGVPIACGERHDAPPPAPARADVAAPGGGGTGEADLGEPAFLSSAACGRCHQEIHAEWQASFHGRAMSDPLFLELSQEVVNKEECIRCHAPVPLREAEFETPVARSSRREDAISCLSCHQDGGHVAGPFGGLQGACRPIGDPRQQDVVKMCFPCHNQHETGNEWLAGPYAPEAPLPRQRPVETCLTCHMPAVERPLVEGGVVRPGRRHTWLGGHSFAMLVRATELDVEVQPREGGGHRVEVFVTNRGAGHAIPTDARHRSFDTYLKLWDAEGRVVLDPLQRGDQERAHLAKFRKFYRGSGKKDTQIPPLARVSTLGEGAGVFETELTAGRGEAWLVYRLTPRDALVEASLAAHEGPDDVVDTTVARVVQRIAFTFGMPGGR
jgi:hypothetical protein